MRRMFSVAIKAALLVLIVGGAALWVSNRELTAGRSDTITLRRGVEQKIWVRDITEGEHSPGLSVAYKPDSAGRRTAALRLNGVALMRHVRKEADGKRARYIVVYADVSPRDRWPWEPARFWTHTYKKQSGTWRFAAEGRPDRN